MIVDCPVCGRSRTTLGCDSLDAGGFPLHVQPRQRTRRERPAPGAQCYVCRERVQNCACPDGPDPD